MNRADPQLFEATVVAELPQQLFRLEACEPSAQKLTAGLSPEARRLGLRAQIRTGQRVLVRRASLDPGRGVITGVCP